MRLQVIPLGLEPKTHSLEGCCSIQLSYGTKSGCKGTHFLRYGQISSLKSYKSSVVEGIKARHEAFCSLEIADIQRVVLFLLSEAGLTFGKGGAEEGVAVGGEHNLPGTEVEGDDGHLLLGYGETVDDGIGDVLVAHLLQHPGDDGAAGDVVGQYLFGSHTFVEQLPDSRGALFGQRLLVGLRILVKLTTDEALAVAHEPHLAANTAEDGCRGGESLLGMLAQTADDGLLVGLPEGDVALAYRCADTHAELVAGVVLGHVANEVGNDAHGVAAVRHAAAVVAGSLRRGAVDDGNEVVSDDDSVLAFLRGIFRDEVLFDYCHACCPYTRRSTGAGLPSRAASWH